MTKNPFAQLHTPVPRRLPASTSATLVIDGKRITGNHRAHANGDEERAAEIRRELERARSRERYQRARLDPVKVAKRKAYYEANKERILAYKREYQRQHAERHRALKTAWAQRYRAQDPEKHRAVCRDYYWRNREKILAKARAQTVARREDRQQEQRA